MSGSYKELEVYELAHKLGVDVHRFSLNLPKYELYESGSQLRRACKSISANIVEGYGRRCFKAEFLRFLIYAQSSCDETKEWLEYIRDCHEPFAAAAKTLLNDTQNLGRKLYHFIQSVQDDHRSTK